MHQCKALNFQIVEEKPVNAKLDFQGEIITTGAVSEEAIADAVDKYFEKNPVIVEEIDPTIYQWAKQPNKPKYTADEIEGALTIEDKISLEDKIKEVEESGIDGKSAYEIAVDKGFQGTEEEWLESLKGAIGEQGPAGSPGIMGPQGPKGDSGVYVGTEYPLDENIKVWIDTDGEEYKYELTEEDKEIIAQKVLEILPTTKGVKY